MVVSGGVNARALREHFLSNGFDIVALGEGERTIVQIVEEFSSEKPDYTKVERIAFRDGDKTITTSAPRRKGTKFIDHLPSPLVETCFKHSDLGIPHWGLPVVEKNFITTNCKRLPR